MYELNGFVYGSIPDNNYKIVEAKPLSDMMMILTFESGERRLFDATILKGDVFKALQDKTVFEKCEVEYGVVTWMNGDIDCAPEYMYENSFEYPFVSESVGA